MFVQDLMKHMLIEMQLLEGIDNRYDLYSFFCTIDETVALLVVTHAQSHYWWSYLSLINLSLQLLKRYTSTNP